MSKHKAARHRGAPARARASAPARATSPAATGGSHRATAPARPPRRTAALTGLAVAATGVVVTGGVLATASQPLPPVEAASSANTATSVAGAGTPAGDVDETALADQLAARESDPVSRSDRRDELDRRAVVDPTKAAALDTADTPAEAGAQDLSDADPRDIARALLPEFGFGADQFSCLDALYVSESNWRVDADNPTSSAYGIPQALPGSKMASAGADWATNPETQIRWGLGYIKARYGTPCSAWSFKQGHNWY